MRQVKLGSDFQVSAIGLGCSSMSHGYNPFGRNDLESLRVIQHAVELGITLFDTADVYGPFSNERLVGLALKPHRDTVMIATKCGLIPHQDGKFSRSGRPEHVRQACEASLGRLKVDVIDLYQLHRVDPEVPVEDTWGAMADLVAEGKVRRLGISHATEAELESVHRLHPIAAVQYELSILATQKVDDILPWSQKNSVGFLAFAPIGRGYLSGKVDSNSLVAEDSRVRDARFSTEAMRRNQVIVQGLRVVGHRHRATAAQVAIAWAMAQGENVVPIPGTRRHNWLEENAAAVDLRLTAEDIETIRALPIPMGEMSWDPVRLEGKAGTAGARPSRSGAQK